MKKNILSIVIIIVCVLSITSCAAPSYISYDTRIPAEWIRPSNIRSVGLINHTADSLSNVGADINDDLAARLVEDGEFYSAVVLDSLLEDTLQADDVASLTKTMGVDCLISLDSIALFFAGREKGEKVPVLTWNDILSAMLEIDSSTHASVQLYAAMNIYIPGKQTPYAHIAMSDQLGWSAYGYTEREAADYLPSMKEKIDDVIDRMSLGLKRKLLPYWETIDREVYVRENKNLVRAKSYIDNKQWDKAAELWQEMFKEMHAYRIKALAAHNLFVYYEMNSKPDEAIEWCKKGARYFKLNGSSLNAQYLLEQIPALEKRKEELKRLDQQAAAE